MERIILSIKDSSKLHFFLELLKQFDFIEIHKPTPTPISKHHLERYAGIWSEDEAAEMKKIIEEGCEQIHESEW